MKKNLLFVVIFTLFFTLVFVNKDVVVTAALNSFTLWQTKIFTNLFIAFVIQDVLINYNASFYINYVLNNLFSKIFGLSSSGQMVFTFALISGSPSNAYIISELIKTEKITTNEANHLLKFTYFANPLFLFTMLSFMFTTNDSLKIILACYLSNIILGIASKKEIFSNNYINLKINPNFGKILTSAIKKSINTLIIILGSVSFFMILSAVLAVYFNSSPSQLALNGVFEITTGLNSLINFSASIELKKIIATAIISFGGLSIHSQVYAIISEVNLSYKNFLIGRLFGTIISVLIIILI